MPKAFDGTIVPETLAPLPCGGIPTWDYGSAAGYRCENKQEKYDWYMNDAKTTYPLMFEE